MTRSGWQNPWVRTVTTLLTAAVMVMIFCFSMENAETSDKRSGFIAMPVIRLLYPDYEQLNAAAQDEIYAGVSHVVRKCAHFTEYMVLGFLLRMCLESWFGHRIKNTGSWRRSASASERPTPARMRPISWAWKGGPAHGRMCWWTQAACCWAWRWAPCW